MTRASGIIAVLMSLPVAASAEVELSFYGGLQTAPASDVSIRGDFVIADTTFEQGWEGRSLSAPPYFGIRATWWLDSDYGYGLDFTHNKLLPEGGPPPGFSTLEFADGFNTLTMNAYRRWDEILGQASPYIGGGIGLAIPHVEVTNGASQTSEYQITGPAATLIAGASFPITDRMSLFGEYKGTLSSNTASLESGGTLSADILTNAVNVGVSFDF